MAANEVHVNDRGTVFTATFKDGADIVDISAATTKQLLFKRPNNTLLAASGTFSTDGTDGKLKYTMVSGDLNVAGIWRLQGRVITGANEWFSDITSFKVFSNL